MTFKKQFWAEFIGGCYAIKIKGNETPHMFTISDLYVLL